MSISRKGRSPEPVRFAHKTRRLYLPLILGIAELCVVSVLCAQDLAPRAYVITPLQANAITITYSYYSGNVLLDCTAPITGATASTSIPIVTLYHTLNFFGRSANVVVGLPYEPLVGLSI
jgi:hypothetical protein